MLIDLQVHSTYSDGYFKPTELISFLKKQGIKITALTDHNTVSGWGEFHRAAAGSGIKAIPGLELYAKLNSRHFNILWYNFDPVAPELHDLLRESQVRRRQRVRRVLEKLANRGFKLAINKILDKYNHYIPINHVIDDIITSRTNLLKIKRQFLGKQDSALMREEDIIRRLFFRKEIGVLRESNISIGKIFHLRKKIGGRLILCHPARYTMPKFEFLKALKKLGLDGIEVISPHHTFSAMMILQDIAQRLNFITTGGSDYHRNEGNVLPVQNSSQYFRIDSKYLSGIKEIIG